jgi:hypothetical protein
MFTHIYIFIHYICCSNVLYIYIYIYTYILCSDYIIITDIVYIMYIYIYIYKRAQRKKEGFIGMKADVCMTYLSHNWPHSAVVMTPLSSRHCCMLRAVG